MSTRYTQQRQASPDYGALGTGFTLRMSESAGRRPIRMGFKSPLAHTNPRRSHGLRGLFLSPRHQKSTLELWWVQQDGPPPGRVTGRKPTGLESTMQETTPRSSRMEQYERLCETRYQARRDHLAASSERDIAARVIADCLLGGLPIPDAQLDDYGQKDAEVGRLQSAWFDCRDQVETFMGRPAMVR